MKYEVSLKDLRQAGACYPGYNKLVRSIQGVPFTEEDERRQSYIHHAHKEPVPIVSILETNGLDDALWALRCVPEVDRDARLFGVWCARQVQHLMEDQRSCDALNVAESLSRGEASAETLIAARDAARDAALEVARDAVRVSARSAARSALADAAWDAAWNAAWDAAMAAARDAAWAALAAARGAAWAATLAASRAAARAPQEEMLKRMCQGKAEWQTVKALVTH